jgi:hypothetical protein
MHQAPDRKFAENTFSKEHMVPRKSDTSTKVDVAMFHAGTIQMP